MSPVLFMFLMTAFAEILEDDWTALGLRKSKFSHKDNSSRSTRKLASHRTRTFLYGTIFDLFCILYVDDGEFVFESRTDIEIGITLLSDRFARFGLEMHVGTEEKNQKLNWYFPHPQVSLTH